MTQKRPSGRAPNRAPLKLEVDVTKGDDGWHWGVFRADTDEYLAGSGDVDAYHTGGGYEDPEAAQADGLMVAGRLARELTGGRFYWAGTTVRTKHPRRELGPYRNPKTETHEELRERVIEECHLERLYFIDHPEIGGLTVNMLRVTPSQQGRGYGRCALEAIITWADGNGRTLYLTPEQVGTGMSKRKLEAWYGRLGFVKRPSGHGDFQVSEKLMREPKRISNDADDGIVIKRVYQDAGVGVNAYLEDSLDPELGYTKRVGGVRALWWAPATQKSFERRGQVWPEKLTGTAWDGAPRLFVGKSYLDPGYRGQGLGVRMYEKLMEVAEDTDPSGRWYRGRHTSGPFIFMAESSWLGSGTSTDAERIWEALARRYPSVPCAFRGRPRRCPPMILAGAQTELKIPNPAKLRRSLTRL